MLTTNLVKQLLPSKMIQKMSSTNRISYHDRKQKFKNLLHNMSVAKQLQSNTMLIVILLAVVAIVGLFNQISMNSRLASFYKDSYAIETASLYAKSSLSTIQTCLYKAMLTEKPNLQTKYVNQSEEAYKEMLAHLEVLYKSTDDIKSLKLSDKEELIGELDKATRYREKIQKLATANDIKSVFSTYKNDYAPILVSISATLDTIIENASTYADMYIDQSQQQTIISIILFLILTLLGILSAVILSKLTAKHILEPVNEIEYCLSSLANGNLEYTFQYNSRNELGKVCDSTKKTLKTLQQYISGITSVLKQLESKNLTIELTTDYKGDFIPIKESLESICHFLNENIHIIKTSSEHISELSKEVNDQSLTIEQGAKEQTKTLDTLYMNLNDITTSISETVSSTSELDNIANTMIALMRDGYSSMLTFVDSVDSIKTHSSDIASIIDLINSISNQTKLVALNASIEAANAGSYGNAFMVVANEIKNLASQCSEAAKTIKNLIGRNLEAVNHCVDISSTTKLHLQNSVAACENTYTYINKIDESCQTQQKQLLITREYLEEVQQISSTNEISAEKCLATTEQYLLEVMQLHAFVKYFKLS